MHKAISVAAAVEKIPDGASLLIGGFMGVGSPHRLIAELVRQGRRSRILQTRAEPCKTSIARSSMLTLHST